jgi:hypothetical protein
MTSASFCFSSFNEQIANAQRRIAAARWLYELYLQGETAAHSFPRVSISKLTHEENVDRRRKRHWIDPTSIQTAVFQEPLNNVGDVTDCIQYRTRCMANFDPNP